MVLCKLQRFVYEIMRVRWSWGEGECEKQKQNPASGKQFFQQFKQMYANYHKAFVHIIFSCLFFSSSFFDSMLNV